MKIELNFNLKEYNTFGVDCICDRIVFIDSVSELLSFFKSENLTNFLVIGNGSNILFTKDFKGTIIKLNITDINIIDQNEKLVECSSSVDWDYFVHWTLDNNFFGLENLISIPSSVGAAPIQNIGAYGVEICQFIDCINYYDVIDFEMKVIKAEDCDFSYRNSIFKKQLKGIAIITSIIFKFPKENKLNISYKEIEDFFNNNKQILPSSQTIAELVKKIRYNKLPDYKKIGNAGSFFKNPTISDKEFELLKNENTDLKFYKLNKGYKIPAGWLIEKCNFKGTQIGNVGCFEKQSLIIVNYNNASGEEINLFSNKIVQSVFEKFNILLEKEVNII